MINEKHFKPLNFLVALLLVLSLTTCNLTSFAYANDPPDDLNPPIQSNHIDEEGEENDGQTEINGADKDDVPTILENIAANYIAKSDEWVIMDMAAYQAYNPETPHVTTLDAKQAYINYAISIVNDYTKAGEFASPDGEYAKATIALQSLGIDPQKLYRVNNNTPLNCITRLKESNTVSIFNAVYVLPALMQGEYDSKLKEESLIELLLRQQDEGGAWGYEYDGFNPDLDGTAMAITALSPYYLSDDRIEAAIDKALDWLNTQKQDDGTYPGWNGEASANSTAMVMIALCSMGITPHEELDGLLSLLNDDWDGFTSGGVVDSYATEQGFRGLIAYSQLMKAKESNPDSYFNIYDFSSNPVIPGRATGEGYTPNPPSTGSDKNITVKFRMEGLGGKVWIGTHNVTLPSDAKVYHLLTKVLDSKGYEYEGAHRGYIVSITNPNGDRLSEFSHGPNSGWLYKVNGELPSAGLLDHPLTHGDFVLWYYTGDWKKDPSAGNYDSNPVKGEVPDVDFGDKTEKIALTNLFDDISEEDWFYDSIDLIVEKGIFKGISDGIFAPRTAMTRSMFAVALWRLAGEPHDDENRQGSFSDVPNGRWDYEAVTWASENGLMKGVDNSIFNPTGYISREQAATVLSRYIRLNELQKETVTETLIPFSDLDKISPWAMDAVKNLSAQGLINGKGENRFAPQDIAIRAEIAALFQRIMTLL